MSPVSQISAMMTVPSDTPTPPTADRALEAAASRECENEREYLSQFTDLLQHVSSIAKNKRGEEYKEENAILSAVNEALIGDFYF